MNEMLSFRKRSRAKVSGINVILLYRICLVCYWLKSWSILYTKFSLARSRVQTKNEGTYRVFLMSDNNKAKPFQAHQCHLLRGFAWACRRISMKKLNCSWKKKISVSKTRNTTSGRTFSNATIRCIKLQEWPTLLAVINLPYLSTVTD